MPGIPESQSISGRGRLVGAALVCASCFVAVTPFLLSGGVWMLSQPTVNDLYPFSDEALIELYTLRAAGFGQLTGPYSRFRWHHPGPMMFYLLLPAYLLVGGQIGLAVGAVAINLAAALLILQISHRLGGRRGLFCAALLTFIYSSYLGFRLAIFWNPYLVALPFAALLFSSAAVGAGRIGYLPAVVILASFLVQSHVGLALPVIALLLLATAASFVSRHFGYLQRRAQGRRERPLVWIALAALLALLLWLPPLLEEVGASPGNLTRLAGFVLQERGGHDLAEIVPGIVDRLTNFSAYIATKLLGPVLGKGFVAPSLPVTLVLAALLAIAIAVGLWRRNTFIVALAVACLLTAGISILSATKVTGQLEWYLFFWLDAVGLAIPFLVLLAAAIAVPLSPPTKCLSPYAITAGLILLTATTFIFRPDMQSLRGRPGNWHKHETVRRLTPPVMAQAKALGVDPVFIDIPSHHSWDIAAGVILQLRKAGLAVGVAEEWLFMFGDDFHSPATAGRQIWFCDKTMHLQLFDSPFHRLVGEYGETYVYSLDADGLRAGTYQDRLEVTTHRARGAAAAVSDGSAPSDGQPGRPSNCLVLRGRDSWLTIRVPKEGLAGIIISCDANSSVKVAVSTDRREFREIGVMGYADSNGIDTTMFFSSEFSRAAYLRLAPSAPEGRCAIAEVALVFSPSR